MGFRWGGRTPGSRSRYPFQNLGGATPRAHRSSDPFPCALGANGALLSDTQR